ncbi:MAG TPA: reverse transcriptase family protein, partial [Polyangiaceae bacterium]|nr:reverse transcriptase family protein [Polyangiaceae bacterium]
MTAIVAPSLSAARPAIAGEVSPAAAPSAHALEERRRAHDERVARWQAIREAGGIDPWVGAQIKAKGLSTEGVDPAKLSDKERDAFKEKKRAEAAERRALRKLAWAAYKATHVVHLGPEAFWRDETKPDAFDVPRREERARHHQLESLANADDLAKALGVTLPALRWMTYHRDVDTGSHYRRWSIPKRDGSSRTITAPKRYLKEAQRWALRNVFEKFAVHGNAHGFLAGRSIVTNAAPHAGADLLVKVDVKDFFPSVSWRRVKGLLRKGGLPEGVATLLALLATEAPREPMTVRGRTHFVATGPRALPQGAPTSPAITNALCVRLDRRLSGLARAFGFRYTRYTDDLTFSWRRPP